MAIIKQAKNIKIKVYNNDVIIANRYTQTSEEIIIESLVKDVSLSSMKKIISIGDVQSERPFNSNNMFADQQKQTEKSNYDGYFYQEDGMFLGKSGNSEDVYITDKATFDKIKNKEKIIDDSKVIAFTSKYKLNNKELLNRANWAYGEGGGYIVERYAMTIENLKKSGKSGYGPTPFKSEEEMYQRTMLHGAPAKCLYPQYFDGTYGAPVIKNGKIIQYENSAYRFAKARKSTNYSELNSDPKMKASIKAVIDSLIGKLKNEGYNNWRGSANTLYTSSEKDNYIKNFKQPKDQNLVRNDKSKTVYAIVKTSIDHFWEPVGQKFRRHSFYIIKREMKK